MLSNIDLANYEDDNTPYVVKNKIKEAIELLDYLTAALFQWFSKKLTKANPSKFHFITRIFES